MKFVQVAFLAVCALSAYSDAQQQRLPEPVPILKQISKQNDDGSYSFGYEAGDGSFKIETKYPDGSVQGKYGYVDDSGKVREVEYGASSKRGFEPQGNDINVPPPTLSNDKPGPLGDGEEDDGQYREDPSIYDTKEYRSNLQSQKPAARRPSYQPVRHSFTQAVQQPAQQYSNYEEPAQQSYTTFPQPQPARQTFSSFQQQPTFQNSFFQQSSQPKYSGVQQTLTRFQQPEYQSYQQPQFQYNNYQQPQPQYNTYQQQQQQQQPQYPTYNVHPSVKNFDVGSGSYSINYSGRR